MNEFALDLEHIRADARKEIDKGAVTSSYGADRERMIDVLNEVLATELVCVLRYRDAGQCSALQGGGEGPH